MCHTRLPVATSQACSISIINGPFTFICTRCPNEKLEGCIGIHKRDFRAPLSVAPLRQLAAAAPGHGSQRGGWCCAPFARRRRRSSKSYSVTRQQLVQLWQGTLQLVYGWFTEGFDTADLQEAKTLLDELQS